MDDAKTAEVEQQKPADFLDVGGERISVRHEPGNQPGIFWLAGYRSDMLGSKAVALHQWTKQKGLMLTRHDYSGHGESSGKYYEGTISKWLAQSLAVFRRYIPTGSRQILVGSSMGAWIALRMVQELNKKTEQKPPPIAGLVLLAPAPDFTVELMEPELNEDQRNELKTKGFYLEKSEYFEEGNIWSQEFFQDARENNRVMGDGPIEPGCPVCIIHGSEDKDVPVKLVDKLVKMLPSNGTKRINVTDGDHRLSRPEDIDLILQNLGMMVDEVK